MSTIHHSCSKVSMHVDILNPETAVLRGKRRPPRQRPLGCNMHEMVRASRAKTRKVALLRYVN